MSADQAQQSVATSGDSATGAPGGEPGRVVLRRLTLDDAPFILELLNDPEFVAFVGDKQVRSLHDAEQYLTTGPIATYAAHGFGLWCSALRTTGTPMGICGFLKREWLEDVDIGFAMLPEFRGRGYAREAAALAMARARAEHGLGRIVAIVSPGNTRSERLLGSLGFAFERMVQAPPGPRELQLFACP